jgi:crotonobetainyl-CoA:carnitine CoA-transferase CaiB-like acyl-CoA transferase
MLYRLPVGTGALPQVNTGWFLDGEPNGYRIPPPRLGAHRSQVLAEWLGGHNATIYTPDTEGTSS